MHVLPQHDGISEVEPRGVDLGVQEARRLLEEIAVVLAPAAVGVEHRHPVLPLVRALVGSGLLICMALVLSDHLNQITPWFYVLGITYALVFGFRRSLPIVAANAAGGEDNTSVIVVRIE